MRFLLLTQYYVPEVGAAPVRLQALTKELIRAGHEVEVVTALPNYPFGRIIPEYLGRLYCQEEIDGAKVHRIWIYAAIGNGIKRVLSYASFAFNSVYCLLKVKRPDFILVGDPPPLSIFTAVFAARIWRSKVIYTIADLWPDAMGEPKNPLASLMKKVVGWNVNWGYRRANFVSTVTHEFCKSLTDQYGVPESKLLFMPNGVDMDLFYPLPPDSGWSEKLGISNRKVILFAGAHGYWLGMDVIVETAQLMKNEDIIFLLVGDGSDKQRIMQMAAEKELSNILFHDSVSPEEVSRLYSIAFAGLTTYKADPIMDRVRSARILANMACQKPVVFSGAGEQAQIIQDFEAGIVTPPGDAKALARVIRTLARNPDLCETLGKNARKCIEERYSWSVIIQNWLEQIEKKS